MSYSTEILKKIGLSDKEIKVYLAGLKAGPLKASALTRKTGFSRPSTYDTLKSLSNKGLVNTTGKSYNLRFVMVEPAHLDDLLERKKRDLETLQKNLKKSLPEFESLYNPKGVIPKIRFYEGIEGMKTIWEESLKCQNKEILGIMPSLDMFLTMGEDFIKYFVDMRVKKGIKTRTIRLESKEVKIDYFQKHKEQLRDVRYAPKDLIFNMAVLIYDDKTAFISSKRENFGFVVQSQEFTDYQKSIFEKIWQLSRKSI